MHGKDRMAVPLRRHPAGQTTITGLRPAQQCPLSWPRRRRARRSMWPCQTGGHHEQIKPSLHPLSLARQIGVHHRVRLPPSLPRLATAFSRSPPRRRRLVLGRAARVSQAAVRPTVHWVLQPLRRPMALRPVGLGPQAKGTSGQSRPSRASPAPETVASTDWLSCSTPPGLECVALVTRCVVRIVDSSWLCPSPLTFLTGSATAESDADCQARHHRRKDW